MDPKHGQGFIIPNAFHPYYTPPRTHPQPDQSNIRRRGTIACRRCRKLRTKCVHEQQNPPCEGCRIAGPEAATECSFPKRGEKDIDRQFRRRPPPVNTTTQQQQRSLPATLSQQSTGTAATSSVQSDNDSKGDVHPMSPPRSGGEKTPKPPKSLGTLAVDPNLEDALPPMDEITEGVNIFVTSYFQLGFLHKAGFLEDLTRDVAAKSKFLLTCILSISARFTPELTRRYGGPRAATDYFIEMSRAMVSTQMYKPTLERTQAFFLLAIAHSGQGDGERSCMDMGVAVRMAAMLRLHCEESYAVAPGSSSDQVVKMESARRVFWMILSQENLHSGYKTPAPFPLEDITALLPCDEGNFAFGSIPHERAALPGTPPAIADPSLANSPRRCLFATLIQAHSLWGNVSRRVSRNEFSNNKAPPWDPKSEFQKTVKELRSWEDNVPPRQTFSDWNLRAWKSECLHLAFLSVTMVLRLANIVARRQYLENMLAALTDADTCLQDAETTPTMATDTGEGIETSRHQPSHSCPLDAKSAGKNIVESGPPGFWAGMADEMFQNVWEMHNQINAYVRIRSSQEGFPQILVFCVYMCGSLSSYLWRYNTLCPRLSIDGLPERMFAQSRDVLSELHGAWPTSSRWQQGLQHAATPMTSVSPASADQNISPRSLPRQSMNALRTSPRGVVSNSVGLPPTSTPMAATLSQGPVPLPTQGPFFDKSPFDLSQMPKPLIPEGTLSELINVLPQGNGRLSRLGSLQIDPNPNELFSVEMETFFQGDFSCDPWQGFNMELHG